MNDISMQSAGTPQAVSGAPAPAPAAEPLLDFRQIMTLWQCAVLDTMTAINRNEQQALELERMQEVNALNEKATYIQKTYSAAKTQAGFEMAGGALGIAGSVGGFAKWGAMGLDYASHATNATSRGLSGIGQYASSGDTFEAMDADKWSGYHENSKREFGQSAEKYRQEVSAQSRSLLDMSRQWTDSLAQLTRAER